MRSHERAPGAGGAGGGDQGDTGSDPILPPTGDISAKTATNIRAGVMWIDRGLPVFPIAISWDPAKGKTNKRPLTDHGYKDATTDRARFNESVHDAFTRLRTGEILACATVPGAGGYVVFDDDNDPALRVLDDVLHLPPHTYRPRTGSGCEHRWLNKRADVHVSNRSPWEKQSIDIRSDAGYVVCPGTVTPWGEWTDGDDQRPWGTFATVPQAIWDQLVSKTSAGGSSGAWKRYDPATHDPQLHPATVELLQWLTDPERGDNRVDPATVTFCTRTDGEPYLQVTRPGKDAGISGTIGYVGPGALYVFSSNWPGLRINTAYHLHALIGVDSGTADDGSSHQEQAEDAEGGAWRLRTIDADKAVITRVKYLWEDRIPIGANTLAPGEEGVGKTTVCSRIAADLTRGLLPGEYLGTPKHVIIVAPEDGVTDVAIPRLKQAGADLSMVTFVASRVFGDGQTNESGIVVPRDLALLADLAREKGAALVWFDSFVSVMPDDMKTVSYKDVNKVMQALKRFAEDMRVAVLAPWHLNKTAGSDTAMRMMDSRGFRTAVRSLLLIVADPERPGEGLVALDKANATDTTKVPALRYRLTSSEYTLDELDEDTGAIVTHTATCGVAEFIGEEPGFGRDAAREMLAPHMEREDDPKGWLRDYLTAAGESASEDVYKHGKEAGHSRSAIHRAAQRLGVAYRKGGFPNRTWWRLPSQSSHLPYPQTTGTTGTTADPHAPGESQKEMDGVVLEPETQSSQSSQSCVGKDSGTTGGTTEKPRCNVCGTSVFMKPGEDTCANCKRDAYRKKNTKPTEESA